MNHKNKYPHHPIPSGWSDLGSEQINLEGYSVVARLGRYDVEFSDPLLWDSQEFRDENGCDPTPANLAKAFAKQADRLAARILDEERAEAVRD